MVDLLHTFLFVLMAFFFYLWPSCFAGALFFLLPILLPSLSLAFSCLLFFLSLSFLFNLGQRKGLMPIAGASPRPSG